MSEIINIEDLSKKDLSAEEIQNIWKLRRGRMALRRQYFEPLWRNGIGQFFQGIMSDTYNGQTPLYNSLYEQYDMSLFSRDGLRFNNLKYPLIHAITMRALAAELPNKPKVNFVAVGSNDPTKPAAFRHLFNQVLYEMDADAEDFEIFLDKRVFGSSIAMVMTEEYEVTINDPYYDKKAQKYSYKESTKKIKQCLYKKLDLRHVYLDEHCIKTNLSDCRYAQVDEYYSKGDIIQRFVNNKKYNQEQVQKALVTPSTKEDQASYQNWYDAKDAEFYRVTHCFDQIADRYHIEINGIVVNNDLNAPIPRIAGRRGKMIPLALAVQYKIPGAPYGYGDSHLSTSFNQIKDLMRMMILEITQKTAKPTVAVDPLSNFDEEEFEWGMDFMRVAPKDLVPIPISPNLDALYKLDELTDNDIIRVTGININDTTNVDVSETARKTIIRRESQVALVELTLGYMSDSFFMRLYTLLKDDIRLHYGVQLRNGEKVSVKTKDVKLQRKGGGFEEEKVNGFRYFELKPGDIDFDMELDLELGNMASSRELDKALMKEGIDATAAYAQFFDGAGMAKWIQETQEMPDYVLPDNKGQSVNDADPKQLANEGLDPSMLPQSEQIQQPNPLPNEQPAPTDQANTPLPALG